MSNCDIEHKGLITRINKIQGQLNTVKKNLESQHEQNIEPYEFIRQLSTIKGGINSLMNSYMEHFIKEHLALNIKNAKTEKEAIEKMETLVKIVKSFAK